MASSLCALSFGIGALVLWLTATAQRPPAAGNPPPGEGGDVCRRHRSAGKGLLEVRLEALYGVGRLKPTYTRRVRWCQVVGQVGSLRRRLTARADDDGWIRLPNWVWVLVLLAGLGLLLWQTAYPMLTAVSHL